MKRLMVLVCCLFSIAFNVSAQTNFSMKLYAGSNAPWGESQYISIDSKGKGKYDLSELGKGIKDSLSFTISPFHIAQLRDVITKIQFFKLNTSYNAQSRDGTRLSVEISVSERTHTVNWINIHTQETSALLDRLNSILKSEGINIYY